MQEKLKINFFCSLGNSFISSLKEFLLGMESCQETTRTSALQNRLDKLSIARREDLGSAGFSRFFSCQKSRDSPTKHSSHAEQLPLLPGSLSADAWAQPAALMFLAALSRNLPGVGFAIQILISPGVRFLRKIYVSSSWSCCLEPQLLFSRGSNLANKWKWDSLLARNSVFAESTLLAN